MLPHPFHFSCKFYPFRCGKRPETKNPKLSLPTGLAVPANYLSLHYHFLAHPRLSAPTHAMSLGSLSFSSPASPDTDSASLRSATNSFSPMKSGLARRGFPGGVGEGRVSSCGGGRMIWGREEGGGLVSPCSETCMGGPEDCGAGGDIEEASAPLDLLCSISVLLLLATLLTTYKSYFCITFLPAS